MVAGEVGAFFSAARPLRSVYVPGSGAPAAEESGMDEGDVSDAVMGLTQF
jgi:hypothetical protein